MTSDHSSLVPCLEMRGISKSYPGVQALDRARLSVSSGECHALVGENGAGKSTLMKILAGAVLPDSGEIFLGGEEVLINSPLDARRLGISMIYQELNLLPELTVAENIFLGREPRSRTGFLDRPQMIEKSRLWLSRLHQNLDPRRPAKELTLAELQMVEIVKALSLEARVMIMDEPSSILTDRELDELFRLVAILKRDGMAIVYISHRLEEIFRICDRVTVMRDGATIATHEVSRVSHEEIVREMVGREVARIFPARGQPRSEVMLEVRNLTSRPRLHDISLRVLRGEIVGLSGLVGAGRSDLARAVFGAAPVESGEIEFEGNLLVGHHPPEAIRRGIGLLTEDRKGQGLLLNMTVRENITLANLKRISRGGWVSRRNEGRQVSPLIGSLRIKTPTIEQNVGNLSGGNQQKAIVARWLFTNCRFLIVDEPTRGIDVGAKSEIYQLLAELARQGCGILVISSELPEILGLCHRVYVMREGRIAGEFSAAEASPERLMAAAMGLPLAV